MANEPSLREFLTSHASQSTRDCIDAAIAAASGAGKAATLAHLCEALLAHDSVSSLIKPRVLDQALSDVRLLLSEAPESGEPALSFSFGRLIQPAMQVADRLGAPLVAPPLLLAAALTATLDDALSDRTGATIQAAGVSPDALLVPRDAPKQVDFVFKPLGFGQNLTAKARSGSWDSCPLVGMTAELRRMAMILSGGTDSVAIVGEPGVGKSALLEGLAFHIAARTPGLIADSLADLTLVEIKPQELLAGTGVQGDLEARLEQLLGFVRTHPNVVPFFDEFHTMLDTEDASSRKVATALKPPMAAGQFQCVGATTDHEYSRFIANDEAMNSRFHRLLLNEPSPEQARTILAGIADRLAPKRGRSLGMSIGSDAVAEAVRLSVRYQKNLRLPRKAIQLLRLAATERTFEVQLDPDTSPVVDAQAVRKAFSGISQIPLDDLDDTRADFYDRLQSRLDSMVLGQTPAVSGVVDWLRLRSRGWSEPDRPRGRFLFLGPPGVGKSYLSKLLAQEVLRDSGSVIVRNMAEYKGEGARSRFMGADPGYVGFGQTRTVYSQVMMRPYSVIVLDEIEKAHSELGEILISVLDGSGEDGQGRRVDFSQCIFVMTSNSIQVDSDIGEDEDELRDTLRKLGGLWTGPLVDRIDRIVLFEPLTSKVLDQILMQRIDFLSKRASTPLPEKIHTPEIRAEILQGTRELDAPVSARRLERALMQWLGRNC